MTLVMTFCLESFCLQSKGRKSSWRSKTWKGHPGGQHGNNGDDDGSGSPLSKDKSKVNNKQQQIDYPRKHSLTVPGEPRHFRQLHQHQHQHQHQHHHHGELASAGRRSPIDYNQSEGRSPSEISTSSSCSNSM